MRRRDNQSSEHVRSQTRAGGSHVSLEAWFAEGNPNEALASYDTYPSLEDEPDDLDVAVHALEVLDDELRSAVELTVIAGHTLSDAAELLGWHLSSGEPDKKRVKRARDQGIVEVAKLLGVSHWQPALALFGQGYNHEEDVEP